MAKGSVSFHFCYCQDCLSSCPFESLKINKKEVNWELTVTSQFSFGVLGLGQRVTEYP